MPVGLRDVHTSEKAANNVHNMTVLTFGYPILLRSVSTRELLKDTLPIKLGTKIIRDILTTLVRTNILHNSTELSFDHLKKLSENRKHFRFIFKQVDPSTPSMIVNKGDIIAMARKTSNWGRAPDIRMNKIKGTRCMIHARNIASTSMFRQFTGNTMKLMSLTSFI
jgi:hypothetical protein